MPDRFDKWLTVAILAVGVVTWVLLVLAVYVAIHFLSKVW